MFFAVCSYLQNHNLSIYSTLHKIILSTQLCPFSTCQLNPCICQTASTRKRKNPRAGKELPTLGNALFSSLFRYLLLYFSHQYYALDVLCLRKQINGLDGLDAVQGREHFDVACLGFGIAGDIHNFFGLHL